MHLRNLLYLENTGAWYGHEVQSETLWQHTVPYNIHSIASCRGAQADFWVGKTYHKQVCWKQASARVSIIF